ncbi:ComF family protein [Flavobacterium sp.]|jgi:ComF family protein|uniref:ComF family protein n=1 Tax=Flavobacterium sp. TaxID=239 RepID=UPI0037BFF12C
MLKDLLNLFFPKVCLACKEHLLANENIVCTTCRHHFPLTLHCENQNNEIIRKFYGRLTLEHASALLYFHKNGIVQELIHNLKYKNRQEIGTLLGEWYAEDLKNIHAELFFDAIIPVPLHKKRMQERGYNQMTTFGQAISKSLQIPLCENILHRDSYAKTQSKKNFLERTETKKSVFDVDFTEKDHHKHYLLIDDVITTGSTLEQCGKAILKIPGAKLSIVCMAYTHS